MPPINVVFYREARGQTPLINWLSTLPSKALAKCMVRIEQLAEEGYSIHRPKAAYLGKGIYELRARHANVRYRILFFYFGKGLAVITHGFVKKRAKVPGGELHRAVQCMNRYESDPDEHTHEGQ